MKVNTMTDIFLGRIVKAFGIHGELKFHPSDDFWENVFESRHLTLHSRGDGKLSKRSIAVERSRPHGNNYVVKVDGVENRDSAEALIGGELFIADDSIDVEMPDELLPYQLLGMTAKTEDGEVLGSISSIVYSSAHDIYEIKGKKGSFLVPAVPEFVVSVDCTSRTLVVRPMPGLIDEQS
jgi:16S rRNA processing protein RimM